MMKFNFNLLLVQNQRYIQLFILLIPFGLFIVFIIHSIFTYLFLIFPVYLKLELSLNYSDFGLINSSDSSNLLTLDSIINLSVPGDQINNIGQPDDKTSVAHSAYIPSPDGGFYQTEDNSGVMKDGRFSTSTNGCMHPAASHFTRINTMADEKAEYNPEVLYGYGSDFTQTQIEEALSHGEAGENCLRNAYYSEIDNSQASEDQKDQIREDFDQYLEAVKTTKTK